MSSSLPPVPQQTPINDSTGMTSKPWSSWFQNMRAFVLSIANDPFSGVLSVEGGGTNSGTALSGERVMVSSGGAIVENAAITADKALISDSNGLPTASSTTATELDFVAGVTSSIQTQLNSALLNPMTALGDTIYENGTLAPDRVAGNTTTTKKYYTQTGTGSASASPVWNSISAADVPTLNQNTSGTAAGLSATLVAGSGGTGQTSIVNAFSSFFKSVATTLGDLVYGGASGAPTRLAGDTSNTRKFLRGLSVSGTATAPIWDTLVSGDIPNNAANTSGNAATATTATNVTTNANLTGPVTSTGNATAIAANAITQTMTGATATPTASKTAGWDANINLSAAGFIPLYTTAATAATTTTLTVSSNEFQAFTGSTASQIVKLPAASTMANAQGFTIWNQSSVVITVETSGGNTIQAMASNTVLVVTCINTGGGTGTASWNWIYFALNTGLPLTNPMTTGGDVIYGGTSGTPTRLAASAGVLTSAGGTAAPAWTATLGTGTGGTGVGSVTTSPTASAFAGWDANKNLSAAGLIPLYTTTVTSAATTTLTVASNQYQAFTGSTASQIVKLPVATTLANAQSFTIWNQSSVAITIETSGGNTIQAMGANTVLVATCINTAAGTGTASWNWIYFAINASLPLTNPMTTGGDIIYGGTSGVPTRLANGSSGQVLTSSGTTIAPTWTTVAAGNYTVSGIKTTTYAILTTDGIVLVSGASAAFTVTLPTAVGVAGKQYTIKRTDQTLANIVTIGTTSSQTIDGITTRTLSTQSEQFTVVSDNANWQVQSHTYPSIETVWTPTYSGFGTVTTNVANWWRVGNRLKARINFTSGTTTSSPGSINLPSGLTSGSIGALPANTAIGTYFNQNSTGRAAKGGPVIGLSATVAPIEFGDLNTFSNAISSTVLTSQIGTALAVSGDIVSMEFELPIASWEG